MASSTYALFDDPTDAALAATEIRSPEWSQENFAVVFHRSRLDNQPLSELPMFETGAASTSVKVGLMGAVGGAVLGVIAMGQAGLAGVGAFTMILFGTITGAVIGLFVGVLRGASNAEPAMDELAAHIGPGQVMLAIESSSPQGAEHVDRVLEAHHAHVVHRHLVRKMTQSERADVEGQGSH